MKAHLLCVISSRTTTQKMVSCFRVYLNVCRCFPPHHSRFRSVRFPDPAGRAVLARASGRLSFQAGEFSSTYGGVGGAYEGMFDAVVTSFFVDTAPNVVQVRGRGEWAG